MTTITVPQRLMRPVATRPARRSVLLGVVVGLAAGMLLLIATSVVVGIVAAGTVMPGVRVAGVDVSGLDRSAAESRLRASLPAISEGEATVVVDELRVQVGFDELGRDYDYASMVDAAFAVARSGDPFTQGVDRLRALVHTTDVGPVVNPADADALERFSRTLAERAEIAPTDASVVRDGARFDARSAVDGRAVDPAAVEAALSAALATTDPADISITIAPTTVAPDVTTAEAWKAALQAERTARGLALTVPGASEDEELDPALTLAPATVAAWIQFGESEEGTYGVVLDEPAIRDSVAALAAVVDQEAVDAGFSVAGSGLGGVIPGEDGRTLEVRESADALIAALEGRAHGTPVGSLLLDVTVVEPALSTAEAEAAFPQMRMVSTWTTHYVPGVANGWGANISIPAGDIDGTTVAPGEWFSFWGALGPITTARGYTYGGAIINGRSEPEGALAGGICSTSTTLFNAAMRFGLEIGARENHYYYIDRYPVGLDATVFQSEGFSQDMTFRNDTDAPVVIRGFGSPGRVTFQLWSIPNDRRVVLSQPYITNHRGATDTTRVDPSMAPGTSRRIESPHNGFDATVTRTVYGASGEVIHQDTWFSDYRPVNGIVLTGPAAAAAPPDPGTAESGGTGGGGVTEEPPAD